MENVFFIVFWLFLFAAMKKKTKNEELAKSVICCTTPLGVICLGDGMCKNVVSNQDVFYFVEGGRRLKRVKDKVSAM